MTNGMIFPYFSSKNHITLQPRWSTFMPPHLFQHDKMPFLELSGLVPERAAGRSRSSCTEYWQCDLFGALWVVSRCLGADMCKLPLCYPFSFELKGILSEKIPVIELYLMPALPIQASHLRTDMAEHWWWEAFSFSLLQLVFSCKAPGSFDCTCAPCSTAVPSHL